MLPVRTLVESAEPGASLPSVEPPSVFLCSFEETVYEGLKSDKRRRDWLLGRRTAKRLLRRLAAEVAGQDVDFRAIRIAARPDGSPAVAWEPPGDLLPEVTVTISHSAGAAFCAAAPRADLALGADIEAVEPRHPGFAADYFTEAEQRLVSEVEEALRPRLETAIWSAKEAAFKAIRSGLTVDTRTVSCLIGDPVPASDWTPFEIAWQKAFQGLPVLNGWWRTWRDDTGREFVLTVAVAADAGGRPPDSGEPLAS